VVRVDLAAAGGVDELYSYIKADGRPVAALVVNAGIGAGGAFATDTDLDAADTDVTASDGALR
jgi:short-subunit dehydrogenase